MRQMRGKKEKNIFLKLNIFRQRSTLFRQTLFDVILFLENFLIVVFAKTVFFPETAQPEDNLENSLQSSPTRQFDQDLDYLFMLVILLNCLSYALKYVYYKYLHTWNSLNGSDPEQGVRYQFCCTEGYLKPCQ